MSSFTFITTFAKRHDFGYNLVKSFDEFVSKDMDLIVYGDPDMQDDFDDYENVRFSLLDRVPIQRFIENGAVEKQKSKGIISQKNSDDFLYDAIRFCFKSYCQIQHSNQCKTQYMVWVDSDVEFTRTVTEDDLNRLIDNDYYLSYLHRETRYTETGWIIFNTHHPYHKVFFNQFAKLYDTYGIFSLKHWTDCHAFDHCRKLSEKEGVKHKRLTSKNLMNMHGDHAWKGSPLNDFSIHWKGPRDNHIKL